MREVAARGLYLLVETGVTLRRHGLLTLLTLFLVASAYLIIELLLLIATNVTVVVRSLEEEVRVFVYLNETISTSSPHALEALKDRLLSLPGVATARYVSQGEAIEEFYALGGSPRLLEGLGGNPLPASFELELDAQSRTADTVAHLAQLIQGEAGVTTVQYGAAWLGRLTTFHGLIHRFGLLGGSVVGLAVVVIVANALGLTVYARRDEIAIMRLIGATDGFIQAPFVVGGVALGLSAAALSLVVLRGAVALLPHEVFAEALARSAHPVFLSPSVMALLLAAGPVLGGLGGFLAFHRLKGQLR